jgi:hypothetical protein
MRWQLTAFLIILSLVFIDAFVMVRIGTGCGRVCKRRRRQAREKRIAIKMKCNYANRIFPITNHSCSARPPINYMQVYETPELIQLWDFQQRHCIIHTTQVSNAINFVFILLIFMFIFAAGCR